MSGLVVDASVAAAWALPDERSGLADGAVDRIAKEPAFVPALFWFEIRNLLLVNERRGRVPPDKVDLLIERIDALGLEIDMAPSGKEVLELARRHRLSIYDAAYLELARRRALPLATLDRQLAGAAEAAGVALLAG